MRGIKIYQIILKESGLRDSIVDVHKEQLLSEIKCD